MVYIIIKRSDNDQFMIETTCDRSVDDVISELVQVWNLRLRIAQLVGALPQLADHGVMKEPERQGIDEIQEQFEGLHIEKNEFYLPDPQGVRCGNGISPQLKATFQEVMTNAAMLLSKDMVTRKDPVSLDLLEEQMSLIQGAVTMAFPMGLPEWDTIRLTLEGEDGLEGTQAGSELLEASSAELWAFNRMFERGTTLQDRIGRNEKTTIKARLQPANKGAPGREPVVSEEEKKAMMAYYFKRQEEMKKLSEAEDEEYLASSWADSKSLKRSLQGVNGIRAPGMK